ncbi:MAG TPA: biotin--[acetyl-CoA-carboxylase] ligase [Syntrophomonas sp.]|nr:biotin--[acetyl-CoA-carboxylase] ligase [Syntrophomonas sp.]
MTIRTTVLQALKERKGEWISGEALSGKLDVSRTMVWKHVKQLQGSGYEIESSSRKGYRLVACPDVLSPDEVKDGLTTDLLGRGEYFYYSSIDSTNNQARTLAAEGYAEGTVVVADTQTEGRGRRGRNWYSPAGQGIYISLILRPQMPLKEIPRISLMIAVAVAETLEKELALPARIKWPNDILINGRKVAGILSEAVTDLDGIEFVVAGIGLNINNPMRDFPNDFRTDPTSVLAETKQPASRVQILQSLLASLEKYYFILQQGNFTDILQRGRQLSMVIGQRVSLEDGGRLVSGRAVDIDENGFLVVCDATGENHTIFSGEIEVRE